MVNGSWAEPDQHLSGNRGKQRSRCRRQIDTLLSGPGLAFNPLTLTGHPDPCGAGTDALPISLVGQACFARPLLRPARHAERGANIITCPFAANTTPGISTEHFHALDPACRACSDALMLQRLYDWTISKAEHPNALWVLALVSFVESSVFPIPPDVLMIPMILARPNRAWLIALVALVASVLGGLLGYAIGALAFETIGQPILASLGKADAMAEFSTRFNDVGFLAVLTAGVTPFPYKVITIMSGWTAMPLGTFIATSILARGLRFFIVAGLLWKFGAPIRDFIEKRLGLMFVLFVLLLVGGFAVVKLL